METEKNNGVFSTVLEVANHVRNDALGGIVGGIIGVAAGSPNPEQDVYTGMILTEGAQDMGAIGVAWVKNKLKK